MLRGWNKKDKFQIYLRYTNPTSEWTSFPDMEGDIVPLLFYLSILPESIKNTCMLVNQDNSCRYH